MKKMSKVEKVVLKIGENQIAYDNPDDMSPAFNMLHFLISNDVVISGKLKIDAEICKGEAVKDARVESFCVSDDAMYYIQNNRF